VTEETTVADTETTPEIGSDVDTDVEMNAEGVYTSDEPVGRHA